MAKQSPFRRERLCWLFFGLASLWPASAAVAQPLAHSQLVTTSSPNNEGCAEKLDAAIWDLQAAVTGPLQVEEQDKIRAIFARLCLALPMEQDKQAVNEASQRLTTRGLQQDAVRVRREAIPRHPLVDPVLFFNLEQNDAVTPRRLPTPAPDSR